MADKKNEVSIKPKDLMTMLFYALISYNAFKIANTVDTLSIAMAKIVAVVEQHEKRLDKGGL